MILCGDTTRLTEDISGECAGIPPRWKLGGGRRRAWRVKKISLHNN